MLISLVGIMAVVLVVWGVWSWSNPSEPSRKSLGGGPGLGPAALPQAPPGTPLFSQVFSVVDADSDGSAWFVLDAREHRVHRLDSVGMLTHSFGSVGEGPGEMNLPVALAIHADTVVVVERTGRMHLFDQSGRHLDDRRITNSKCVGLTLFELLSTHAGLLSLGLCLSGAMPEAHALLEDHSGEIQSLAVLHSNHQSRRILDASFYPVISAHPSGFLFGSAGDECLALFDLEGRRRTDVCHGWIEDTRDWGQIRERMERRLRGSGIAVNWGDAAPAFDAVHMDQDGKALYLTTVPGEKELHRVLVRSAGGQSELSIPSAPHIFVARDLFLAAWEDIEGTRILTGSWKPAVGG